MTEDELNVIKARCEAATPGPWEHEYECITSLSTHATILKFCDPKGGADPDWEWCLYAANPADIELMTHAPADVPALLAEVDQLRAVLIRVLADEMPDWKAADEFGGYVLDDDVRRVLKAALGEETPS